jgi:hypothetical protein
MMSDLVVQLRPLFDPDLLLPHPALSEFHFPHSALNFSIAEAVNGRVVYLFQRPI